MAHQPIAVTDDLAPFAGVVKGDKVWHVGHDGRRMACVVLGPTPYAPGCLRSFDVRVTSRTSARYGYKRGAEFSTPLTHLERR